jgi:deoxyribodipyrimidine photo-lyase
MEDITIFIFRRDLRLHDNTTFIDIVRKCKEKDYKILPIFIFNPKQIDDKLNDYYSSNCVQFMIESLKDLDKQLKEEGGRLYYFHGDDAEILNKINKTFNIKIIASNKDITPFAIKR